MQPREKINPKETNGSVAKTQSPKEFKNRELVDDRKLKRTKHRLMRELLYSLLLTAIGITAVSFTDMPHIYFLKRNVRGYDFEKTMLELLKSRSRPGLSPQEKFEYSRQYLFFKQLDRLQKLSSIDVFLQKKYFTRDIIETEKTLPITKTTFEIIYDTNALQSIIESNDKVLVEISADYCLPCHTSFPYLEQFKNDHPEIKVVVLEMTKHTTKEEKKQLSKLLGEPVAMVPMFVFIQDRVPKKKLFGGINSPQPLEKLIKQF